MIETCQELYLNNLLSFRKTLTQNEVEKEMNDINLFIKENGLTILGPKISTTYSVNQAMVPTMDIEILIPVSSEFTGNNSYKFKKEFKLTNCLKVKHRGNPQGMQQKILSIQQYLQEKALIPISSLYTVNHNEIKTQDDLDKYEADIYLSISPNII